MTFWWNSPNATAHNTTHPTVPIDFLSVVSTPPRMTNSSHTAGSTAVSSTSTAKNPNTKLSGLGVTEVGELYPVSDSIACQTDETPSVVSHTHTPSGIASKKYGSNFPADENSHTPLNVRLP